VEQGQGNSDKENEMMEEKEASQGNQSIANTQTPGQEGSGTVDGEGGAAGGRVLASQT